MARYFCRVCYNTNHWVIPSGDAFRLERRTHAGVYAFGWEEWNFDLRSLINNWKYGWIEGFWTDPDTENPKHGRRPVPYGLHDVILYTYNGINKLVIARINCCEHIRQIQLANVNTIQMANQANNIGANITLRGNLLNVNPVRPRERWNSYQFVFTPNIRFLPANFQYCIPININITYDRYGPLLVDNNNSERNSMWDDIVENFQALPNPV